MNGPHYIVVKISEPALLKIGQWWNVSAVRLIRHEDGVYDFEMISTPDPIRDTFYPPQPPNELSVPDD